MGSRLACRLEVDDALAPLPFPPLMLISMVENAIKHGIEPKAGHGQILVGAAREGEMLSVRVEDDGRGLVAGEGGKGIGLANIREQLRTRYGARGSLAIESRPGGGVVATIRVPLETGA
ncbi:sensor histidine kinase [Arenimonas sp.]|uniref:sensor histidine kinase n=1 Tax=Arenimonas sp. TaxID=1872635 RepID=UPI0039E411B0